MEKKETIIPKGIQYNGYLWYSDEQQPHIYKEKELEFIISSVERPSIPFIIEGYLCSGKDSYSIKMIDGAYYIKHYDLETLSGLHTTTAYLPNRFDSEPDIKKLEFARYWQAQPDDLCEGMEVLMPQEEVFIKFHIQTK